MIRTSDKKLIKDFEELVDIISSTTSIDPYESAGDRRKRIDMLMNDYERFCLYYFPEYCFSDFAWFHKQYPQEVAANHNNIYLEQWSRGFAKTTHYGLFVPLYLHAKSSLDGMIIGSHDETMAAEKLIDIKANLEANKRFINDFGDQQTYGNWEDGRFKTKNGTAFYGFGKKQSPRGTKFKWKRPGYGLVDDLNDSRQLKNEDIALEDKLWVIEELKPALFTQRWWLIIAQNKFNDNAVTSLIEQDVDIKKTVHRVDIKNEHGKSNWPEQFPDSDIKTLEESEGGSFIRERMNTPFEEGKIFKAEWIGYADPLPHDKYDGVFIHYLDPSYKGTEKSDYKAWILLGKAKNVYHLLKAWVEKATSKQMWEYAFDVDDYVGDRNTIKHAMEASFIQEDVHKKELERVEADKNKRLRVQMDYRVKPDKFQRIETLVSLFQRGLIKFNALEKDTIGMRRLVKQLLAFEKGSRINDDAPDALEGGIWMIDRYGDRETKRPRSGKYKVNKQRTI